MALSEHASGSQTCVVSTEHTLNTTTPDTTAGIFQFFLDTANLVAGDVLEIRVKRKVISAGTIRQVFSKTIAGVQTDPCFATESLILRHGWDFTIKQTAGTGRVIPWSIEKIA
jgi:hypothetical protein